jgi:hypothetical protein
LTDGEFRFDKVDRIEVIDYTGRAFVRYYEQPGVMLSFQDDDRTLKVFAETAGGDAGFSEDMWVARLNGDAICPKCGAVVALSYKNSHLNWHRDYTTRKKGPDEDQS